MTKKEFERRAHMNRALESMGFTPDECEALRRISMTLHRWHELECGIDGGCIERDSTAAPRWVYRPTSGGEVRSYGIPDREKGALKRLALILKRVNGHRAYQTHTAKLAGVKPPGDLATYIQTDPRGAALYILRPGDVPAGEDAGAYYSRGVAVY